METTKHSAQPISLLDPEYVPGSSITLLDRESLATDYLITDANHLHYELIANEGHYYKDSMNANYYQPFRKGEHVDNNGSGDAGVGMENSLTMMNVMEYCNDMKYMWRKKAHKSNNTTIGVFESPPPPVPPNGGQYITDVVSGIQPYQQELTTYLGFKTKRRCNLIIGT